MNTFKSRSLGALLTCALLFCGGVRQASARAGIDVFPDQTNGHYRVGQKITFETEVIDAKR